MTEKSNNKTKRRGSKDVWNAFMCDGAKFMDADMPLCPTTAKELPSDILTWTEAVTIYNKNIKVKRYNFHIKAYVSFYEDDQKFDGPKEGVWKNYNKAIKIIRHFEGAITPDFSTNQEFPDPIKRNNTYRMRVFGYWLGINGIAVINNVRWGTDETYDYCFSGIPKNSIIAIGTCGGSPHKLKDRKRFEDGLEELIRVLKPHTIITYGSAKYRCFKKLGEKGIKIVSYPSKTAKAFERRK